MNNMQANGDYTNIWKKVNLHTERNKLPNEEYVHAHAQYVHIHAEIYGYADEENANVQTKETWPADRRKFAL